MGRFDQFIGGAPDPNYPPAARAPAVVAPPRSRFDAFVSGPPAPPPNAVDWSKYNKPVGELKADDPSWSEYATQKGQDALIGIGMEPYRARHISEGLTGIARINPILGSVLSGADLTYHLPRGQFVDAAFDTLGAYPGFTAGKRFFQGMPKVPMADVPRGKGDISFLPERGRPDPYGMGPYGLRPAQMPAQVPNDELLTAGRSAYRDTRYSPVEYHPLAMTDFTARAKQGLEHPELGLSPEKAPLVHSTLNRWVDAMSHRNTPITAADWDALRQQMRGMEGADGVAGNRVAGWIDQYMTNPPPGAMIRGTQADLDTLQNNFDVARGNWRAGKTAETVEKAIDRTGTRAGAKNSGLNVGNMTRDRLASLTTTDAGEAKIFGARPDEIAAINDVVAGDPLGNLQRKWSNKLAGGGGAGSTGLGIMAGSAGTAAGHLMGLDPYTSMAMGTATGLGVGRAGEALRTAANERTVGAANDVVDLIRRNSPEYAARARATPPITDPYAMQRDAIAYAMIPQVAQQGQSLWDQAHVPYDTTGGTPVTDPDAPTTRLIVHPPESYDPSLEQP